MTETLARTAALARDAAQVGGPGEVLTDDQVRRFISESLARHDFDGRSVCLVLPDGTRSGPVPLLVEAVHGALHGRVSKLTALIALGTHASMGKGELQRCVSGLSTGESNRA